MVKQRPERFIFPATSVDGFAAYHDLYSSGTSVSRLDTAFKASVVAYRFPSLLLFNRVVAGASHHRDLSRLRRDGFDHFNLQVLRSGTMLAGTPGNERIMSAGDIVVFDTSQPQRTIVTAADYVSIAIRREAIGGVMPSAERLHGSILPVAKAGLLSDFILSLGLRASLLGTDIAASSAMFIGRILAEVAGPAEVVRKNPETGTEAAAAALQRWRAEAYIAANLSSRVLGPDQVARAVGMSRSALYRSFNPTGGVAAFILERRVARLRLLLLRPNETRTIADLAGLLGFAQESHCSRAFKAAFGTSPGQFRDAARDTLVLQDLDRVPHGWADWWNDVT